MLFQIHTFFCFENKKSKSFIKANLLFPLPLASSSRMSSPPPPPPPPRLLMLVMYHRLFAALSLARQAIMGSDGQPNREFHPSITPLPSFSQHLLLPKPGISH